MHPAVMFRLVQGCTIGVWTMIGGTRAEVRLNGTLPRDGVSNLPSYTNRPFLVISSASMRVSRQLKSSNLPTAWTVGMPFYIGSEKREMNIYTTYD